MCDKTLRCDRLRLYGNHILCDRLRSAIRDPRSAIRDPRSAILDPRSAIRDPRSAIRDRLRSFAVIWKPGSIFHFLC